jgi:hypothetical protein
MHAAQSVDLFGPIPTASTAIRKTPVRAHMRRVQGPPPPTGAELRDAGIAKATKTPATKTALQYVRAKLLELYHERAAEWPAHRTPYVNADDADRLIRQWAECPPEIHQKQSQNWRGAVFRTGWTRTVGDTPSLRKHMRATALPGWRPIDAPIPTTETETTE